MYKHPFSDRDTQSAFGRPGLSANYTGPYGSALEENLVGYLRRRNGMIDPTPAVFDDPAVRSLTDETGDGSNAASRDPADVDGAIKRFMLDPRYGDPAQRDDGYRDRVAQLWQAVYPDAYEPGSFGRTAQPKIDTAEVMRLAGRLGLSAGEAGAEPEAGGSAQSGTIRPRPTDGVHWSGIPVGHRVDLETALATPTGRMGLRTQARDQIEALDIGDQEREALLAAVEDVLPEESGADPGDAPEGVQVAVAPVIALPILLGTLGGSAALAVPKESWESLGELLRRGGDALANPGPNPNPSDATRRRRERREELRRQAMTEEERARIEDTPAHDPPEQGTTEILEPEARQPTILITPDGQELTLEDYLETFPDQSDELPQGTIVHITDKHGHKYKIETGSIGATRIAGARRALNRIESDRTRAAIGSLVEGGRLENVEKRTVILDMGGDESDASKRFEQALSAGKVKIE